MTVIFNSKTGTFDQDQIVSPPVCQSGGGGGRFVFKDPLTDGNVFAKDWFVGSLPFVPFTAPISYQIPSIGIISDGKAGFYWSPGGSINPQASLWTMGFPLPIGTILSGKSQYVQLKRIKVAPNGTYLLTGGIGLFVQLNAVGNIYGNGITGYGFMSQTNNQPNAYLARFNGSGFTTVASASSNPLDGQDYRMEGTINLDGSVNIKCFLAGVQVVDYTDLTPPGLLGVPVLAGDMPATGGGNSGTPFHEWRNFECGDL